MRPPFCVSFGFRFLLSLTSLFLLKVHVLNAQSANNSTYESHESSDRIQSTQDIATTVFTRDAITDECRSYYLAGIQRGRETVELRIQNKNIYLDDGLKATPVACHHLYSMGAFDFLQGLNISIQTEYVLERWYAKQSANDLISMPYASRIHHHFAARLKDAGFDEGSLNYWDQLAEEQFQQAVTNLISETKTQVAVTAKPIQIGRFIFSLSKRSLPMTAYEYVLNEKNDWTFDEKGQLIVAPGSYQQQAQFLISQLKKIAKEYVEWRPSIFWGEDSAYGFYFWYSGSEKSPREIKEDSYLRSASAYVRMATELGLDTKPFIRLLDVMNQKNAAFLEREIAVFDSVETVVWALPTLPISMYVAGLGLTTVGFKSLPYVKYASTFQNLVYNSTLMGGAKLAYAANASAAVTLGTLLGVSAYRGITGVSQGIQEARDLGQSFHFLHAIDHILLASVSALPVAEQMTTLVGVGVSGVKMLAVGLPALMLKGWNIGKFVAQEGLRKAVVAARSSTWSGMKWYGTQWWNNRRLYLFDTSLEMLAITGIEIGTRQSMGGNLAFFLPDEQGQLQWWNPKYWNKESLISLTNCALVVYGIRPVPAIGDNSAKGVATRFVIYRTASLSASMTTLAAKKAILGEDYDFQRLGIDLMYNLPVWGVVSELDGRLKKSKWMLERGKLTQGTLKSLWFLSIHAADVVAYSKFISFVRSGAFARFALQVTEDVDRQVDAMTQKSLEYMRRYMHSSYGVDLSNFSDIELLRSMYDYLKDDVSFKNDLERLK